MTAQIIDLALYRAEHPEKAVNLRIVIDPLWWPRFWLGLWGIR